MGKRLVLFVILCRIYFVCNLCHMWTVISGLRLGGDPNLLLHCTRKTFKRTLTNSFIYFVCLTTGLQPLTNWVLDRVRSSPSFISLQYLLLSLRSSSSCLRLLPRLPVTSILSSIFPSMICFRRQVITKIWPIQVVFFLFTVCRVTDDPGSNQDQRYARRIEMQNYNQKN